MADRNTIWRKIVLMLDRASARKAERDTAQSVGRIDKGLGKLKKAALAAGAAFVAAFSIQKLAQFARSSIGAAIEAGKSWNRLTGVLHTVGMSFSSVEGEIRAAARAMQDTTTLGDEQFAEVLSDLIQITGDYEVSLKNVGLVADVMAGKQIGMAQASRLVGLAAVGETGQFKKLGIVLKEGETGIEALRAAFGGMAQNEMNTLDGKLKALNNEWGDFKEAIGKALTEAANGPSIIERLTQALKGLTAWVETNGPRLTHGLTSFMEGFGDQAKRTTILILAFRQQMAFINRDMAEFKRLGEQMAEIAADLRRRADLRAGKMPTSIVMPPLESAEAFDRASKPPRRSNILDEDEDENQEKRKRTREQEIRGLAQARQLRILTAADIERAFALEKQLNAEIAAGAGLEVEKRVELENQLRLIREITAEEGIRQRAAARMDQVPTPRLTGPTVTPVGLPPIARLPEADLKRMQEKRAQDAFEANTAMLDAIEMRAEDAAMRMSFAFESMGDAMIDAFRRGQGAAQIFAAGFVGLGRAIAAQLAQGLSQYFAGKAAGALGEFFLFGNPGALAAFGYFSAASGIMAALASAAGGGGGGRGGNVALSRGGAGAPSGIGGAEPQREINIYLVGSAGALAWDVDFQKSVGTAVNIVKENYGENWTFNVNTRRRAP